LLLAFLPRPSKVVKITSPASDYNLYTSAGVAYPLDLYCFISAAISSTSSSTPAFRTGTPWKGGTLLYIQNSSTITGGTGTTGPDGAGGAGGIGGIESGPTIQSTAGSAGTSGTPGGTGGPAFTADTVSGLVTIVNNTGGTFTGGPGGSGGSGGGGGGGGGAAGLTAASKGVSAVVNEKKIISDQLSAEKRLDICNRCPHLEKKMGRCDLCGCFVSLKVKLDFETCPAGKW